MATTKKETKAATPAKMEAAEAVKVLDTKVETPLAEVKTAEVKTAQVKETPAKKTTKKVTKEPVKKEPVKIEEAAAAEKKRPGRKPKTAEVKEVKEVKETKPAAKKSVAKAVAPVIHVQFAGKSYSNEKLMEIAKDVWTYDLKGEEKDLQSVELYVKPEEAKVYYVFNGNVSGDFDI